MAGADEALTADEAAEQLYGVVPKEFTALRDQFVARAKAAGDRSAAKEIGSFRKPSTGAWLANRLVRERPDDVRALLDLGASLREAQSQLRGEQLRDLARQRRQAVNALVKEARRCAVEAQLPVGDDVARQLEQTLEAALSSDDAAQQLASGRLVSSLTPTAEFGSFTPQLRVVRETQEQRGRRKAAAPPTRSAEALAAARNRVKAAEAAATKARRQLADAGSRLDTTASRVSEQESAAADLQAEIDRLAEELRGSKESLTGLRREHQEARRALTATERETRAADRRVEAARAELDALE